MDIQTLLGELPKAKFVEQYFHRFPYSSPRAANSLCDLGTWDLIGAILAGDKPDVLVVREGIQTSGPLPTTLEAAQALIRDGSTVLIRHAEKHDAGLQQLARSFASDFRAPVDIHVYVTPSGRHGFGWHYDAEDVFIIQTGGSKQYSLRKNTVHPWPLVETLPADMAYPREIMPLMRVALAAGDWLYIPCGYWHKAEAIGSDEPSLSLALGVLSPAALDVFDFVRSHLLQSLVWRQRLPVSGDASPLSLEQRQLQYSELFRQLADDLSRTFRDEKLVRSFLERSDK